MKQRIITALVLTPIAIAIVLLLPSAAFAAFMGALALLALWEWTRLIGFEARPSRITPPIVATALMAVLWLARDDALWWIAIGIGVAWWAVAALWLRHFSFGAAPTRENRWLKIGAGLLVVVPAWAGLIEVHRAPDHGHVWALFALVIVWAADTFAYLAGRRFGTTKLAPRISPGKTIAGVWGALIGSGIVAAIGGALFGATGLPLAVLVLVALVTVAFSIVGDLFESLIKRQANVKDSGTLFPGHGGLFDRLDSVFAALPVFAAGKALFDLVAGS